MVQSNPQKYQVFTALLTVQVLFGINYVVSKVIVGIFPPLIWASFRVVVSAIALVGISTALGRKHPPFNRRFFYPLALYALLGVIINQSSFLVGLHYTTSTNSAILNTLIPVFTLLFVTLAGQEPLSNKKIVGFLSALAGVLVIRKIENFSLSDQTLLGDSLTVLNCISYGLFLTVSKKFIETHDPLWTTTWLFILGGFGLTFLSIPSWSHFHWPEMTLNLLACMAFSILGSTLLAYMLNLWALARTQSSSVALYIYLQPIVASLLAWFYFGEIITLRTLLASLLIFGGMLLGFSKKTRRKA